MDYKRTKASDTTVTRDIRDFEKVTGNPYEAIYIISKRADQISSEIKDELNRKLKEFASYSDNLEEIFENREQIEISKFYERLPKPALIAIEEFLESQIYFRNTDVEEEVAEI